MATDIIDPSMHLSAFPSTYIGPGTVVGNCVQSGGDETDLHGYFTSDGNATQINIGFRPMRIRVTNTTDVILWDWMYGFPATDTIKTVSGGTVTLDTGSAIVSTEQAGLTNIAGNWITTLSATLCGTSKNICFHIEG
jgi:hypothetical protein